MSAAIIPVLLFDLGRTVSTRGAIAAALEICKTVGGSPIESIIYPMIARHAAGDWGDLDAEDRQANLLAVMDGSRILSAYVIEGERFYVITDATNDDGKREVTTVLLPSEY